MYKPTYDAKKFAELLIYIASKCSDDASFGATKLNKILFFSDFLAYANLGESITGAAYQKLDHGPAPRELLPALDVLRENMDAVVQVSNAHGYKQKRLVALRSPVLGLFSANEIAIVDDVIEGLRDRNASEVSRLSHILSIGWKLAKMRETIPYESVFVSADVPTESDITRGQELAREHGWMAAAT